MLILNVIKEFWRKYKEINRSIYAFEKFNYLIISIREILICLIINIMLNSIFILKEDLT